MWIAKEQACYAILPSSLLYGFEVAIPVPPRLSDFEAATLALETCGSQGGGCASTKSRPADGRRPNRESRPALEAIPTRQKPVSRHQCTPKKRWRASELKSRRHWHPFLRDAGALLILTRELGAADWKAVSDRVAERQTARTALVKAKSAGLIWTAKACVPTIDQAYCEHGSGTLAD